MPQSDDQSVSYAPKALSDLQELAAYLVEQIGNAAASQLLEQLRMRCDSVSKLPLRYPVDECTGGDLRRASWKSWFIYYRADHIIEIVRILHQSRNISPSMLGDLRT